MDQFTNVPDRGKINREDAHASDRNFIIAKKGNDYLVVKLEAIACFYTKEKLVFAVDKEGKKMMVDDTALAQLEERLDPETYFRINRQVIVSIHYIRRFRIFQRQRIEIELDVVVPFALVASQSGSIGFRKWIYAH
ncbi:MAG: LytTR family transcriptional regulator DNA-binding domain-containing protein [Flavisolibacter sp.]